MPYLETPEELADHLADLLGIYQDPRCNLDEDQHAERCNCRAWWVPRMADRIRCAAGNEVLLRAAAPALRPAGRLPFAAKQEARGAPGD